MTATTGKTENEIKGLASTLGVDLTSSVLKADELLAKFGMTAANSVPELNSQIREQMIKDVDSFLSPQIERLKAQEAGDQMIEEIFQSGGKFENELDMMETVNSLATAAVNLFPDDPLAAARYFEGTLGPGGDLFQPGAQLFGVEMPPEFNVLVSQVGTIMGAGGATGISNQIVAQLAKGGIQIDNKGLKEMLDNLSPDALSGLAGRLGQSGATGFTDFAESLSVSGQEGAVQYLRSLGLGSGLQPPISTGLSGLGPLGPGSPTSPVFSAPGLGPQNPLGPESFDADLRVLVSDNLGNLGKDVESKLDEEGQAIYESITSGFQAVLDEKPEWWSERPSWWNEKPAVLGGGSTGNPGSGGTGRQGGSGNMWGSGSGSGGTEPDTNGDGDPGADTTTSRLARTMGRHNFYNSMLPGKRTVTSSLRNTNLGSLNSDHLTGNAYDLTGQNLVGYSNLVNQSGGFAEFHGSGFDRHLHVVPGATPMGDTMTPAAVMVSGGGGGSSTAYNITINAAQGQDPNAIAAAVMAKIDDRDRNMKERA